MAAQRQWHRQWCVLFVSNIGSEHLVGLSGSAASSGLAVGFFEWHASFALLVLGWVCAPIYIHNKIATLPEYLERRYSPKARTVLAVTSLIAYVLSKLSVSVFSGATIAHVVFGIDKMVAAVGLILITAVYTIFGGLTAVILTDVAQSVVMLIGCITILIVGLMSVGGMSGLKATVPQGLTAEEYEGFWHMMRPPDDPDYPWPGLYFGVNAIGLWYWCTDMAIAQRVLAARSLNHARAACLFAAILKLTPVFIMCIPGIIARALYGDCVAGEHSNDTFALLIVRMLPQGLVGLLVAATLAAAMSSIDSVATAGASLFCLDIYRPYPLRLITRHCSTETLNMCGDLTGISPIFPSNKSAIQARLDRWIPKKARSCPHWLAVRMGPCRYINPEASEKQLVHIGRMVIAVMAVLTVIWLPIITV